MGIHTKSSHKASQKTKLATGIITRKNFIFSTDQLNHWEKIAEKENRTLTNFIEFAMNKETKFKPLKKKGNGKI